jgi:hypothetical protein
LIFCKKPHVSIFYHFWETVRNREKPRQRTTTTPHTGFLRFSRRCCKILGRFFFVKNQKFQSCHFYFGIFLINIYNFEKNAKKWLLTPHKNKTFVSLECKYISLQLKTMKKSKKYFKISRIEKKSGLFLTFFAQLIDACRQC